MRLVNVSGSPGQALCRLAVLVGALACMPAASVAQNAETGMEVNDVIGSVEIVDGLTGGIQGRWADPPPPGIPAPDTR